MNSEKILDLRDELFKKKNFDVRDLQDEIRIDELCRRLLRFFCLDLIEEEKLSSCGGRKPGARSRLFSARIRHPRPSGKHFFPAAGTGTAVCRQLVHHPQSGTESGGVDRNP